MKNYEGFKGKSLPLRDVMWWAVFEVWLDPDKTIFMIVLNEPDECLIKRVKLIIENN